MTSPDPLVEHPRFVADLSPITDRLGGDIRHFHPATASVLETFTTGARFRLLDEIGTQQATMFVGFRGDGILQLTLSDDEDVALRSARAWTLLRTINAVRSVDVDVSEGLVVISHTGIRAEVRLDRFALRVLDSDGRLVTETQSRDRGATGVVRGVPTGRFRGSKDTLWSLQLRARPDEAFHGLGEHSLGFNKRGQRFTAWTMDAYGVGTSRQYKPVPFVMSTAGYGIVVNSGMPVAMDLAADSAASVGISVQDTALDVYILVGATPEEILSREHALTAETAVPPRWALGLWMSTGFLPQTQETVEQWLQELQHRDFPTDVVHIDPYWMRFGRWSDLAWDRTAFPDPRGMLDRLHDAGLHTCLWINPYIGTDSDQFAIGDANGFFLRDSSGKTWTGAVWGDDVPHSPTAIVDFTNPAAREWFEGRLEAVLRDGVDVFKTDFGEGVPEDTVAANGMTGLELHNVYPLLYNEAVADVTERVNGHRLVWGRSSYLGGQRHAAQWGGDTATTWEGMASSLRAGLSYGMTGFTFWSHDVGGFDGRPTEELFVRWAEWGALSPLARLHGTTSRIPWEWDAKTYERLRAVIDQRYALLPYILSEASHAVDAHRPLLRPMMFEAPRDPRLWDVDSCYLLGNDLLVAPARDEEGGVLAIVPEGEWIEYGSSAIHTGGTVVRLAPEGVLPVLVRAGAIVPTAHGLRRVPDQFRNVTLTVWRPSESERVIVDGDARSRVQARVDRGTLVVSIDGPLEVSRIAIRAPRHPVQSVRVNGAAWSVSHFEDDIVAVQPH